MRRERPPTLHALISDVFVTVITKLRIYLDLLRRIGILSFTWRCKL